MDLETIGFEVGRAFVADCACRRRAELARGETQKWPAKSDVSPFQIDASKHGGGNKYASCGRTSVSGSWQVKDVPQPPTGPQPSTSEDARKRHLLHRRGTKLWVTSPAHSRNFGPRTGPARSLRSALGVVTRKVGIAWAPHGFNPPVRRCEWCQRGRRCFVPLRVTGLM